MTTGVAGFIPCSGAVDGVPLPASVSRDVPVVNLPVARGQARRPAHTLGRHPSTGGNQYMRPTRPIALLTLALLAGCGPAAAPTAGPPVAGPPSAGGAPTSAGRSTGGNSAGPQCPADADVSRTLGVTVANDGAPARFGTMSAVCTYNGKRADGGLTSVQVHMQIGDAQREYDALK